MSDVLFRSAGDATGMVYRKEISSRELTELLFNAQRRREPGAERRRRTAPGDGASRGGGGRRGDRARCRDRATTRRPYHDRGADDLKADELGRFGLGGRPAEGVAPRRRTQRHHSTPACGAVVDVPGLDADGDHDAFPPRPAQHACDVRHDRLADIAVNADLGTGVRRSLFRIRSACPAADSRKTAIRPFSQPPCASPLAPMEQNNPNVSSLSMISSKTVLPDNTKKSSQPRCAKRGRQTVYRLIQSVCTTMSFAVWQ
jgi:hypothetical protein